MKTFVYHLVKIFNILGLKSGSLTIEEIMVLITRLVSLTSKYKIFLDVGTSETGKTSTLKKLAPNHIQIAKSLSNATLFGNKVQKSSGLFNEELCAVIFDEKMISDFDDDVFSNIKTYSSGNIISMLDEYDPSSSFSKIENCNHFQPAIYFTRNLSDFMQEELLKNPKDFSKNSCLQDLEETTSFIERMVIIPSFLLRKYSRSIFSDQDFILQKENFLEQAIEKRKNKELNLEKILKNKDIRSREYNILSDIWKMMEIIFDIDIEHSPPSKLKHLKVIVDFISNISNFKYTKLQDTDDGKRLIVKSLFFYLNQSSLKGEVPEKLYFLSNRVLVIVGNKLAKLAINIKGVDENKEEFEKLKNENYSVTLESFNNLLIQERAMPNMNESEFIIDFYEEHPEMMMKAFTKLKEQIELENQNKLKIFEKLLNDIALYTIHKTNPPIQNSDEIKPAYHVNKEKFKNAIWAKNIEGEDVIFSLFK